MNRRDFFKKSTVAAGAAGLSLLLDKTGLWAQDVAAGTQNAAAAAGGPELAAIAGGEPAEMLDKAMAALGGMERFVKKGQTVLLKPNMSWDCAPETGANTNVDLMKHIAELCVKAGAGKVYVMDHNIDTKGPETSGVKAAAEAGGAIFVVGKDKSMYKEVDIPGGKILQKALVHQMVIDCDVFINIPVLKHHGGAQLTIAMKNLMGCVYDRKAYHGGHLDQCIVDFLRYRKPDLNIVDAYRVMTKGGPGGKRNAASIMPKMLLISPDIVAVDTAGEAQAVAWGIVKQGDAGHIKLAAEEGLGEGDLKKVKVIRLNA